VPSFYCVAVIAAPGNLDYANLGMSGLVALGTIGAVIAALWLARRASREAERQRRDAQKFNARQVIAVMHQHAPDTGRWDPNLIGPGVELFNGSPEVITSIVLQVSAGPDYVWTWARGNDTPGVKIGYLAAKEPKFISGNVDMRDPQQGMGYSFSFEEIPFQVTVTWDDGYGKRWARTNNGRVEAR
jgi:hypothetical protein